MSARKCRHTLSAFIEVDERFRKWYILVGVSKLMTIESDGFLRNLNPDQTEAVLTTEGAVRVIAGPGTGKTRTLTARYCHLVKELDVPPRNILCVTFTNRAAEEMKRRIRDSLKDMDLAYICTFHAFCTSLLREDSHVLHYPRNFVILDVEDQKHILQNVFKDMGLTSRESNFKKIIADVLEAKKLRASDYIDQFYILNNEELKAQFACAQDRNEEIFLRYLYEQKKCFAFDFNDLINFGAYILENFTDIRQKWQNRMQYVMVDEFQDVSERQYKIARILSEKHGNLFIVGDSDQTIYSWRGAHIKLFLGFDKEYSKTKTILLSTNYRSTPEILNSANALIEKNVTRFKTRLTPTKKSSSLPIYFHAPSDKAESAWICEEIQKLSESGTSFNRITILYRSHYLSRVLEETLIEKNIPYKIYSGVGFYCRKEIKEVICYMRMVTNGDDIAFIRTVDLPKRKIGKKKLEVIKDFAEKNNLSLYDSLKECLDGELFRKTGARRYVEAIEYARENRMSMTLGDTLQTLLDMSGYEEYSRLEGDQERLDNIAELKRSVEIAGEDNDFTLEDFLERAALFTNLDKDESRESVKLMTIHSAKGMEFPIVFICGLNEEVFPSRRIRTPEDMEEERRLAYVAITRAMDKLFLSDAEGYSEDGFGKFPSRFLRDVGKDNIEHIVPLRPALEDSAKQQAELSDSLAKNRVPLFSRNDRVSHPAFGLGTVLEVNTAELCYTIRFDNLATERAIQFGGKLSKAYTTMDTIEIDFSSCKYYYDIHELISKKLEFPEWYGRGMDALWDLLTGYVGGFKIRLTGYENVPSDLLPHMKGVVDVFIKAEKEYHWFELEVM
ncbi:DNA helicase [Clostridia bacterium]|nr:DNA helicase [Clostridia bacterium]